ncbi:YicC/YloC family endoribonuclease [Marinimicrobium sp. ABcell2]|uniref:YicC/YloC family endoribonuclease n=1 Tax=Marinimicrobium sp. ABcell2 TaxID=3069751 RepID=UPI0027AFAF14|nr:YicC/YloC family endoribonuclease [Marinimicrobium sp. ABcell2]MDQ2076715.1 YicC/YloC family endoribonuclease [Marinimicrobium sp. ABcell2]
MPRSMTGFARREQKYPWGTVIWEIRSVNHRYLEPSFRLPEAMREIEPKLRELVRRTLQRGKLEASLHLQLEEAGEHKLGLNMERVRQLAIASRRISAELDQAAPVNPLELLNFPGVAQQPELDRDAMQQAVLELFESALEQLVEHRTREGAELEQFIVQRLDAISKQVVQLRQRLPDILKAQREKLQNKIAALQVELDPDRLEQEIALLAQKADVDEELDRLDTHVLEVKRSLKNTSSLGRRLDFLMQELNREANTLSSKAVVAETTQAAVELKVFIEQMREQIQNIE